MVLRRGYSAGVPTRLGQIAQSLYALKLRATIIGYEPLLVVYGSLKPLPGETYLLHSRAHISYPCLIVIGFRLYWCMLYAHLLA